MFAYLWPIALVICSNVVYQICTKSAPQGMHPLASLTLTYLVAAAASAVLYFALERHGNMLQEYGKMNWTSVVLGLAVVGLETGWLYAYRAGWQVSMGFIVQSAVLAGALLVVGRLLYHESLSWNKLVGVGLCLTGLVCINLKR